MNTLAFKKTSMSLLAAANLQFWEEFLVHIVQVGTRGFSLE